MYREKKCEQFILSKVWNILKKPTSGQHPTLTSDLNSIMLVVHLTQVSTHLGNLLQPVNGKWVRMGNEIRFWDVEEKIADTLIKRMINCLDCGFCMVECFSCRQFDRATKQLRIAGCIQCGRCLRLKFCMGWRHRFWRRIIVENLKHDGQ